VRRLRVRELHTIVTIAFRRSHRRELLRIDLKWAESQIGVEIRHARHWAFDQIFEAKKMETVLYCLGQILNGVERNQRRADYLVLGEQHIGTAEAVEVGEVVEEIHQNGALVLRLDRTINLPQFPQAHDEFRIWFYVQQKFNRMQLRSILVHDRRFAAVTIPAVQEAPHGAEQMRIAALE
jgi:hypothetical protein